MMNATTAFLDDAIGEGHGLRPALHTPGGAATYADLLALAGRVAAGLRARGVGPEDRVALLLPDGLEWAAAFFGALRAGAVAVPLNTRLAGADLATVLGDARPRTLVADPTLLAAVEEIVAAAGIPIVLGFDELLAPAGTAAPAEPVGGDAMAFWLYTSGTTGTPKAAVHLHRNLLAGRHYAEGVLRVGAGDRIFATSKLFFAYALGNALLIPLLARASACLRPDWADPEAVREVLLAYRPTLFFSVPTFYARLLAAGLAPDAFASVRACVSAGERLPAEVYRAWRERFNVEILDGIGATETIFMVLSSRPGASRPGTTGGPVPGTEARLLDAEGRPVKAGEQGVLWVRTPSAAAGYWQRPADTRRAFDGEWFRTGDVYYVDAGGHWVHCGRQDDLFKVAGQWVVPAEVEAVALRHPAVLEAGLVGAEEGSGLIKPYLFVVPRAAGADAVQLARELGERLAREVPAHARPREVRVVAELPRTATGKLQRHRLRDQVAVDWRAAAKGEASGNEDWRAAAKGEASGNE
jgi:benzoate-CoA ligase family protein